MSASGVDPRTVTGVICGERRLDGQAFGLLARRAAAGLKAAGIGAGGTLAILMRNDVNFLVAQAAAGMVGGFAVPLNWHATPDEMAYVLRDSEARLLVVHADLLEAVRAVIPEGCAVVVVPTPAETLAAYNAPADQGEVLDRDVSWEDWLADHEPLKESEISRGGSLGIFYTSGTTGKPKGVMRDPLTVEGAAKLQRVVDEVFGAASDEPARVLVSAPVYHGAPNFFANRGAMPGSLAVLQPRFHAARLLALIERFAITHLYLVPTTMLKLLELPAEVRARYDLSSLRRVVHSAAPCPPQLKAAMIEWLGPVIWEFYGGTECGTITLLSSEDALRKPGSVGRLLQDCELEVVGDDGQVLGPGQIGEIYARNFNTPRFRYRRLPEKQAEVERGELVSIGDVGFVDEEGYLFLCDRKRDMVISAGANIYPAEIEAVLLGMPQIADCIVFGAPDATYGEQLVAHIEPKPNARLDPEEVADWLEGKLARYKIPRQIVIDVKLPREESGKIMKRKVRDRYWADAGRSI